MSINKTLWVSLLIITSVFAVRGQTEPRQPAKPVRPYVVTTAQSVSDIQKKLQGVNKAEDLIGGAGLEIRVAIQHEKNTSAASAEVHDASDDVYYVLDGTAILTLGGTLDTPKKLSRANGADPRSPAARK